MKKDAKEPVVSSSNNENNKLIILLLILIVITGIMTIVFYFSAPQQPKHSAVEITAPTPQLTAQGAVTLQIITPPEDAQKTTKTIKK